MTEKKYQVFISSTYSDLKEERKKILNTLLSADCIPAGMEAFVASDLEQFKVIQRVIDLCDYYILIIGKRYGSINQETGISYTEMEYNYAKEKGIPILVFALDESVDVENSKKENNPEKIKALEQFRKKALTNRLASIWTTSEDLVRDVAVSIMKAIKEDARPGWQKGTDYDETSLRKKINDLQKENKELREELESLRNELNNRIEQTDASFENCEIEIKYHYYNYVGNRSIKQSGSIKSSLEYLFKIIATEMMNVSISENSVESCLRSILFANSNKYYYFSDHQLIKKLLNQFDVAGLIKSKWIDKNLYWQLTPKGKKVRDDMIVLRNKQEKK